jgi:ribosomal protein S18 acetylase RimI-like enzyme
MDELIIRQYQKPDADAIASIINRDPFNLQKGITANEFDRCLDEPGERIRENTFVALLQNQIIGYISLCFCDNAKHIDVYSYSSIDIGWRRKGMGTILFRFIINHLKNFAQNEKRKIVFVHRVDSRIPGLIELAIQHNMVKGHESMILRKTEFDTIPVDSLSGYSFRTPNNSDTEAWAEIYNDAFMGNGKKTKDNVIHEFNSSDFNPDLYILASNLEGEAVAFISSKLVGNTGKIPTIAVKRRHQGKGLGKALLTEVLLRLKRTGVKEVTLSVGIENNKAIKLYGKLGFDSYASRCNYYKEISPKETMI